MIDQIEIHLVPVLLGDGVRLFGQPQRQCATLRLDRLIETPAATHLRYTVVKESGRVAQRQPPDDGESHYDDQG